MMIIDDNGVDDWTIYDNETVLLSHLQNVYYI